MESGGEVFEPQVIFFFFEPPLETSLLFLVIT